MAEAAINGTTLWYDVGGEGRAIVVLHGGLGLDHTLYRNTLGELEDRGQVLWFDQRGNGRSARPDPASITMEQLADDAAALATDCGLAPAVVVGHSYGGFVAQELALRRPDVVAGLVLVATGPGQLGANEVEDEDGVGLPLPEGMVAAMSGPMATDDDLRAALPGVVPFYLHRADPVPVIAATASTVASVEAMGRGFEVLAGWSSVDRLAGITAPTLVVGGRHDVVTNWPQSVRIAKRVAGATLVILEEAGHLVWVDDPDGFRAAFDGFLSDLP